MNRAELGLWLLLAVFLWILADVAPLYHVGNQSTTHNTYTAYGWLVVVLALVRYLRKDREQ